MIQLNYNSPSHHHHHQHNHHNGREQETTSLVKFEMSDDNNNLASSAEPVAPANAAEDFNHTLTGPRAYRGKESDESSEGKVEEDAESSVSSYEASSLDDDWIEDFKPKKSCLVLKSKLFIDTTDVAEISTGGDNLTENGDIIEPANATSSPLLSAADSGFPSSLSVTSSCAHSSNLTGNTTCSPNASIQQASNETSPGSPAFNNTTCLSSSPTSSNTSSRPAAVSKKRVLFADSCGKELFTIRTMSEPSNCPPKLTSKIVQYFLNREFSSSSSLSEENEVDGLGKLPPRQSHSANDLGYLANSSNGSSNLYNAGFFSLSRSYDYGISALNYTTDVNQLSGSIAVYSLNFAQPAGDYLHFRKRLEESNVSLENVVLHLFQVNGTIKVKNIDYHKHVFVRCSFDGWKTYTDFKADYVPCDYYSSFAPSSPTSSTSATFYATHNSCYMPQHKEYDTFRFEFQLPKTVKQQQAGGSPSAEGSSKELYSQFGYGGRNLHLNASIQMCVCYRAGQGNETREFWDSNHGKNYEILQYVIDIERLKPPKKSPQQPAKATINKSASFSPLSYKQNLFEFENVNSASRPSIYY